MKRKILISLCCIGAVMYFGRNKEKETDMAREAELDQPATLLTCNTRRHMGCVYASMTLDTDGDLSTPEYWGFNVFENNAISESAVNQYKKELDKLRPGSKATLRTWVNLIGNVGRY